MEWLTNLHDFFYLKMGNALYYALIFMGIIAIVAQWRLYEKADQPGWATLIPIYNAVVFLRIVGRPASHVWRFFIPVYGQFYFAPKVWIEICQSFGKTSMLDYVLVIIFNGLYILNMGLSYDTNYQGPVYGKQAPPPARPLTPRPMMA